MTRWIASRRLLDSQRTVATLPPTKCSVMTKRPRTRRWRRMLTFVVLTTLMSVLQRLVAARVRAAGPVVGEAQVVGVARALEVDDARARGAVPDAALGARQIELVVAVGAGLVGQAALHLAAGGEGVGVALGQVAGDVDEGVVVGGHRGLLTGAACDRAHNGTADQERSWSAARSTSDRADVGVALVGLGW